MTELTQFRQEHKASAGDFRVFTNDQGTYDIAWCPKTVVYYAEEYFAKGLTRRDAANIIAEALSRQRG